MNVSNVYKKVQQLPTRNLTINSLNRYSGSNVSWTTQPISIHAKFIALRYISFVNNTNMIDVGSQILRVSGLNYTIPTGSYSITGLITAMNNLATPLTFSYSSITNKITATAAVSETLEFSTALNNAKLGRMLGFLSNTSNSITITAATTSVASNQVNLNPTQFVDVISNELARFTGSSFGDSSASLLYRIPIQQYNIGASILVEVQTPKFLAVQDTQLGALSFRLIDQDGATYNLDSNCDVSLCFDCIV